MMSKRDNDEQKFFLVRADILPEAILKTAQAKDIISKGKVETVNQAVDKVGLSRSAFYKYRDGVFPLQDPLKGTIVSLSMLLEHRAGILSQVLNTIARANANILTINQNIPLQGVGHVTISVEIAQMSVSLDKLLKNLSDLAGVVKVELVGQA
nr:ACT domain-containing protein [Desulfitibacter alkalitolerans]